MCQRWNASSKTKRCFSRRVYSYHKIEKNPIRQQKSRYIWSIIIVLKFNLYIEFVFHGKTKIPSKSTHFFVQYDGIYDNHEICFSWFSEVKSSLSWGLGYPKLLYYTISGPIYLYVQAVGSFHTRVNCTRKDFTSCQQGIKFLDKLYNNGVTSLSCYKLVSCQPYSNLL